MIKKNMAKRNKTTKRPRLGLEPRPLELASNGLTIRPSHFPHDARLGMMNLIVLLCFLCYDNIYTPRQHSVLKFNNNIIWLELV